MSQEVYPFKLISCRTNVHLHLPQKKVENESKNLVFMIFCRRYLLQKPLGISLTNGVTRTFITEKNYLSRTMSTNDTNLLLDADTGEMVSKK